MHLPGHAAQGPTPTCGWRSQCPPRQPTEPVNGPATTPTREPIHNMWYARVEAEDTISNFINAADFDRQPENCRHSRRPRRKKLGCGWVGERQWPRTINRASTAKKKKKLWVYLCVGRKRARSTAATRPDLRSCRVRVCCRKRPRSPAATWPEARSKRLLQLGQVLGGAVHLRVAAVELGQLLQLGQVFGAYTINRASTAKKKKTWMTPLGCHKNTPHEFQMVTDHQSHKAAVRSTKKRWTHTSPSDELLQQRVDGVEVVTLRIRVLLVLECASPSFLSK